MFWLVFVWFVLLACCQVTGRPDAQFSAVRQLSAWQFQDDHNVLDHGEVRRSTSFKSARSTRPLFSWDLIPPASEGLEGTTEAGISTTTLLPTVVSRTSEHVQSLPADSVSRGFRKTKRKKNRNRKKDLSLSIHKFTNQSEIIQLDKRIREFDKTDVGERFRESFHQTKERRRKNRNQKDKTGKRRPKSERRKGDRNKRKRKDRKLKKKGKKHKGQKIISNSLPILTNENVYEVQMSKKLEAPQLSQVEKVDLTPNILNEGDNKFNNVSPLPTIGNKITNQGEKSERNNIDNNEMFINSTGTKKEDNILGDNTLLPLLHTSTSGRGQFIGKDKENKTETMRATGNYNLSIPSTADKESSGHSNYNYNVSANDDIKNNYLPIEPDKIHSIVNEQHSSLLNLTNEEGVTSEETNELFNKEFPLHKRINQTSLPETEQNNNLLPPPNPNILTEVNYTTGDLSCLTGTFLPAPAVPHSAIKYIRTQTQPQTAGNKYLIAEYECEPYNHLQELSAHQLFCRQRQWLGPQPICVPDQPAVSSTECVDRGSCDHICQVVAGSTQCSCYKGFRLVGGICRDINECEFSNGGCESECRNTPGAHHCLCPTGLRLADNHKNCVDVNECLLRNGHGPCQDSCHNLWGGYECSCKGIPGTKLATDNHTCQDVDECANGSAGCSHTCLNTLGSAFCLCPTGFMLGDDWKTCQDIDECSYEELQNEHCELGCVNTIGSYHCLGQQDESTPQHLTATELSVSCPLGFQHRPGGNCEDIDECKDKISGCTQGCLNTKGSFHCYCGLGFTLTSDNKTCVDGAEEAVCPPLESPSHGYLECARHLVRTKKSKFPWMKRARVVNHAGSICLLKCPYGYMLEGEYRKTCGQNRQWTGPENGTCLLESSQALANNIPPLGSVQYLAGWRSPAPQPKDPQNYIHAIYALPAPNIKCPNNMTVHMEDSEETAFITITQPTTNVNWFRYVESVPGWGKSLETYLPLGHWEVKFTATHPMSHLTASCTVAINVVSHN